jgi:hypothetical protein
MQLRRLPRLVRLGKSFIPQSGCHLPRHHHPSQKFSLPLSHEANKAISSLTAVETIIARGREKKAHKGTNDKSKEKEKEEVA